MTRQEKGKKYGIGYAAVVEPGMSNMGYLSTIVPAQDRAKRGGQDGAISMATVNVDPLGSVSVTSDTTPQGQGHGTVIAQIVADQLGLRPDDIKVSTDHDTLKDPWSIAAGTYSCRFSPGTAVAAYLAAQKIREKLTRIAAPLLNITSDKIDFSEGKIFDRDNRTMLSLGGWPEDPLVAWPTPDDVEGIERDRDGRHLAQSPR